MKQPRSAGPCAGDGPSCAPAAPPLPSREPVGRTHPGCCPSAVLLPGGRCPRPAVVQDEQQQAARMCYLNTRGRWPRSRCPDVWLLRGAGTSLSAAVDTSIISSVAAFHMPALVTAGLFNFHFSEVFNLSAVGFYSLKPKPRSPALIFAPLGLKQGSYLNRPLYLCRIRGRIRS